MAPPGVTLALTTLMVARHSTESGEAQESWSHAVQAAREMARSQCVLQGLLPRSTWGIISGTDMRLAAVEVRAEVPGGCVHGILRPGFPRRAG